MVSTFLVPIAKRDRSTKLLTLFLLTAMVCGFSQSTSEMVPPQWIIWNVGQGTWITHVGRHYCLHFDAGGDRTPEFPVSWCRYKKNQIYFSHGDWDHISYTKKLTSNFPHLCRVGPADNKIIRTIKKCEEFFAWAWQPDQMQKTSNDGSWVYFLNSLLYPGDSPRKFEKQWMHKIPQPVRILVLGHHGSRTATSENILQTLRPLVAVVSARQSRYGHPHSKVVKNLKKFRIPLLRTEFWGNLHFVDSPIREVIHEQETD